MHEDKKLPIAITQATVAEWITKGHTRQYCLDKLMEDGMCLSSAKVMYYGALRELSPDPNLFDAYKKNLVQQNLDRLEKIVESSISGNTAEKAIAIKAIDTLNKLIGAYGDNNITIAQKDKEGQEQIIRITFDK